MSAKKAPTKLTPAEHANAGVNLAQHLRRSLRRSERTTLLAMRWHALELDDGTANQYALVALAALNDAITALDTYQLCMESADRETVTC